MKKAQASLTKTGILFTVLIFYGFIIAMIGFYAGNAASEHLSTEDKTFLSSPLGTIIIGIKELGWLNALLFTPLVVIIAWIIITTFTPTADGGG